MRDGPSDPNDSRGEREEPPTWDEDVSGGGPSTMDRPRSLPILQSPYIPRPIDNTALDAYMSCPRKYYYSMVRHRRGRSVFGQSPALSYGTTWHAIMEAHFKTGGDTKAVVDAAAASWKPHGNPEDHRTLERAVTEYGNYLREFGTHEEDAVRSGRTVGFDTGTPIVECPAEATWSGAVHPYTGKIDRIFSHNGLYYVEDHKTTSAMGPTYFRQFDPSNQMMGYAWLAQLYSGLPIAGVRINAHAVLKGSSKFQRQTIMFSQERLEEWAENLRSWMQRLEISYNNYDNNLKLGTEDPQRAALRAWPHNFNACAGKYGQCMYTDVCTYPAQLRDKILESTYDEVPWNPLNPEDE